MTVGPARLPGNVAPRRSRAATDIHGLSSIHTVGGGQGSHYRERRARSSGRPMKPHPGRAGPCTPRPGLTAGGSQHHHAGTEPPPAAVTCLYRDA